MLKGGAPSCGRHRLKAQAWAWELPARKAALAMSQICSKCLTRSRSTSTLGSKVKGAVGLRELRHGRLEARDGGSLDELPAHWSLPPSVSRRGSIRTGSVAPEGLV